MLHDTLQNPCTPSGFTDVMILLGSSGFGCSCAVKVSFFFAPLKNEEVGEAVAGS